MALAVRATVSVQSHASILRESLPAGLARRALEIRRLGVVPYPRALRMQDELVARRRKGEVPDQLIFLEHPHVITLGSASRPEHILVDHARRRELGIEVSETGRGGDVTYHGPGQLIGYPIVDLKPDRRDVHRYLRDLEEVLIRVVRGYGIACGRQEGRTGVWTEVGKVAAIGVRVSSGWITSHGFALNVGTDLSFFDTIVPCGISGSPVASLEAMVETPLPLSEVMDRTADAFCEVFGRSPVLITD